MRITMSSELHETPEAAKADFDLCHACMVELGLVSKYPPVLLVVELHSGSKCYKYQTKLWR